MAHITLSVPDSVYEEMKKHPEIKWSEVARKSIIEKTVLLKKSVHSKDLLNLLSPEASNRILKVKEGDWLRFYKEAEKKGWKRTRFLTQAQR